MSRKAVLCIERPDLLPHAISAALKPGETSSGGRLVKVVKSGPTILCYEINIRRLRKEEKRWQKKR